MAEVSDTIPTFAQRAAEANLPLTRKADELVDKVMVVLEWEPSTAIVPETGKVTEGFLVTSHLVEEDETVVWFCGQQQLVRALKSVKPPFQTTIRKPGRSYIFS